MRLDTLVLETERVTGRKHPKTSAEPGFVDHTRFRQLITFVTGGLPVQILNWVMDWGALEHGTISPLAHSGQM